MKSALPAIEVRNTTSDDFPGIIEICRLVYPDSPAWRADQLSSHLQHFPEGQFVAIEAGTNRIVGMAASLILLWADYKPEETWGDFTDNGMFTNHDPEGHTLYGASKAFLIKFSEALSNEVRQHNVHVTALCPGFTWSEFHDVTGTREQMNRMPRWMWMDAATVARQGFDAVMAGQAIFVTGRVNRTIAALVRHLPQRWVYSIGRRVGRSYRKA